MIRSAQRDASRRVRHSIPSQRIALLAVGHRGTAPARVRTLGHTGGFPGWSSEVVHVPAPRCTIVVLANARPTVAGRAVEAVVSKIVAQLQETDAATR